jgi:hypothetical protein
MPSTDTKPELTAKASMAQPVSQPAVYANGLTNYPTNSTDLTFMEQIIANLFLSTNELQRYTVFFIFVSALRVSSGFSAHHQELKNCICSIGMCQT